MSLPGEDSALGLIRLAAHLNLQSFPDFPDSARENACAVAAKNATMFGRILPFVEAFLRSNDEFAATILIENLSALKFPISCLDASVLNTLKRQHLSSLYVSRPHTPSLACVRWRVDITISSSVLSRVLEPNLIMEWKLSDGQNVMFELSVARFHKLRYTVASLLKEMNTIEMKLNSVKS